MVDQEAIEGTNANSFLGFESLDANFIYCPNQFFDFGLRYSNRSTTRFVSHVLYSTLRWRDDAGNPINQSIAVPHKDLREKVKISKGSFDEARTQAIDLHLIEQVIAPQSKAKQQKAVTGCYAVKWDAEGEYCTTLGEFNGFYAKEGNRTAVPGEFFTVIIPSESLNVIKVVGAVIRHTIGYESQFGRRQVAALSLSRLQDYTGITNRTRLIEAITRAVDQDYIVRVTNGVSVKDSPNPESATYSIKWLQKTKTITIGTKKVLDERSNNGTTDSVQKRYQHRSRKGTSIGSEKAPENRFRKGTNIKKILNQSNKQQVVVALLMKEGFTKRVAQQIATGRTLELVQQQVDWLTYRDVEQNPLGMLRRAIEENWSEPTAAISKHREQQQIEQKTKVVEQQKQQASLAAQSLERIAEQRAEERLQKKRTQNLLLTQWQNSTFEDKRSAAQLVVSRSSDLWLKPRTNHRQKKRRQQTPTRLIHRQKNTS